MKKSHEIAIKQSEAREKLAGLMGKDTRTDSEDVELRELQAGMPALEREFREALSADDASEAAALLAGGGKQDAEERERRELASRVGTAPFIAAASQGLAVSGAARELSDAYGAAGHMPLTLLGAIGRPDQPRRELRAVTPGVTEDGTDPTAPYIFQRTVTEQLVPGAIRMVPAGSYHSVTMTTAPEAGLLDKSANAPVTAGAFTLATRRAVRVAGQAEFQIEDSAILADMESRLQETLTTLIASQVDTAIVTGKAASPDFDGLLDIATDVARPGADQDFGAVKSAVVGHVDGRYAYGPSDLQVAIGSTTYALMEGLYQSNGDMSVYDILMRKLGMLAVSDRVPSSTNGSKSQKGLIVLGAGGGPPRVEVPVWNRLELIRDQFTQAKKGVVTLTATALIGAPVVRYGTDVIKELHFRFA